MSEKWIRSHRGTRRDIKRGADYYRIGTKRDVTDPDAQCVHVFGPDKDAKSSLIAAAPDLLEALKGLLAACEDDCGAVGDITQLDGDDAPVGGDLDEDGNYEPMALTFGHLRRAARAIAKAEGRS